MVNKSMSAFKTIGELAKELELIDEVTGKPKTHVIRFWEQKFKILKPSIIIKKHRYYSETDVEILKELSIYLRIWV